MPQSENIDQNNSIVAIFDYSNESQTLGLYVGCIGFGIS